MKVVRIDDDTYTLYFDEKEYEIIESWSKLIERPIGEIIKELIPFGFDFFIRLIAGKE